MNLITPLVVAVAALGGGDGHGATDGTTPQVPLDMKRVREIRLIEKNKELVRKGLRRAPGTVYRANSKRVCHVYLTHRKCWLKPQRKHRHVRAFHAGRVALHHVGTGRIVPVPGFPGESASSTVIPQVEAIVAKTGARVNDCFGQGHASPGHTVEGTACDFGGSDAAMDRVAQITVPAGLTTLYDGRYGTEAAAGHGPSYVAGANAHIHVEFHLSW